MRVAGEASRTAAMHCAKCSAPPSRRSSRSTLVITTYFSAISAMVSARWRGSSTSGGSGVPWPTSQNGQRRVHRSPRIMKVAVPWPKHSPRLGHEASSHTVCSLASRRMPFSRPTFGRLGDLARIHDGRRMRGCGTILIGMRAVFAAPLCWMGSAIICSEQRSNQLGF